MNFKLPQFVLYCLNTLEINGFEAFCVGGAVRDHIMGKTPFDYDITTNALPEEIISLFPKTVPTGIKHGTITVVTDGGNVEITTYRADGEYSDHRTPDQVKFVTKVDADLSRRDFTMNAICYNPKSGFYDPENGINDIEKGLIRAIGNPEKRFTEDALRIMRAFRFSSQLGFEIEDSTKNAAISLSNLLQSISVERIFVELKRAITSKFAKNIEPLLSCGAFSYLGLNCAHLPDNFNELPCDFSLRFAVVCNTFSIDHEFVLNNLKSDNTTINDTTIYLKLLKMPIPKSKSDIKRMLNFCEIEQIKVLLDYYSLLSYDAHKLNNMLTEIIENNEPYRLSMLQIDGKELIELGYKGKEIGNKLDKLLQHVIDHPEDNYKEILKTK